MIMIQIYPGYIDKFMQAIRKRNVHTKEQIVSFLDIYSLTFFVHNNFNAAVLSTATWTAHLRF